jgi:hypothetical protein
MVSNVLRPDEPSDLYFIYLEASDLVWRAKPGGSNNDQIVRTIRQRLRQYALEKYVLGDGRGRMTSKMLRMYLTEDRRTMQEIDMSEVLTWRKNWREFLPDVSSAFLGGLYREGDSIKVFLSRCDDALKNEKRGEKSGWSVKIKKIVFLFLRDRERSG